MTKRKQKITPKKIHNLIKKKLRLASLSNPSKNIKKNESKVAPATFECEHCGAYCYEGNSEKNLKQLKKTYPNKVFKKEKIEMNHVEPVIGYDGFIDWNTYIDRLFCDVDGYNALCKECHIKETQKQNNKRIKP